MSPDSTPEDVAALVEGIVAADLWEQAHRAQTLEWLATHTWPASLAKTLTPSPRSG